VELGLCEPDIVGVWLGEAVGEDVNVELGVAEKTLSTSVNRYQSLTDWALLSDSEDDVGVGVPDMLEDADWLRDTLSLGVPRGRTRCRLAGSG